jgi:hypothetical protein
VEEVDHDPEDLFTVYILCVLCVCVCMCVEGTCTWFQTPAMLMYSSE